MYPREYTCTRQLIVATMVSINRLKGSRRKPKGMLISPDISQRPVICMGACMDQFRTSRKTALASETPTAAMEIPAERRACGRAKSMMSAKAANGVSALRAAARRFASWVHARFTVTP